MFTILYGPLRAATLPLLHDTFIPFFSSGQQRRFQAGMAAAWATMNLGDHRVDALLE